MSHSASGADPGGKGNPQGQLSGKFVADVALRKSGGFAISVPETEAVEDVAEMGRFGLYLETSSAIVYGCLQKAVREDRIGAKDTVLLVLTSNGYKNRILE